MDVAWRQEAEVDVWVKNTLDALNVPVNMGQGMSPALSNALKGASKTVLKTGVGIPDLTVETRVDPSTRAPIPVLIEDKLHLKRLEASAGGQIKQDDASVRNYALNGALYYARSAIASGAYTEAVAIGVAGDNPNNVTMIVLYVYGSGERSYKRMNDVSSFDFLESQSSFNAFLGLARLSEEERHIVLLRSRAELQGQAKRLNKMMHDLNITAAQRVLYVAGMLLAMQDVEDGDLPSPGLTPQDLKGSTLNTTRDGQLVYNRIANYLTASPVPEDKQKLMLASFSELSKDTDRDIPHSIDKDVKGPLRDLSKLLPGKSSATKQIFTFLYEYVYRAIDGTTGQLDIMGEMYSEFMKYALGDGKEIGIVLTPPYVTSMMAALLDVDDTSRVLDLATGSAGFLIASMERMLAKAQKRYGAGTTAFDRAQKSIKEEQLLGIELNAEMYALATTNMILRGDGSSRIEKADSFKRPPSLYSAFKADRLLLNPPFSFREKGMPFLEFGLRNMEVGAKAAIIIQDSAGSGQALSSNASILKHNQMLASIKMPIDLFQPMAGVQTSIYVFEHTNKPHDYDKTVRFIDFRHDGYKRSKRALYEVDQPSVRYSDVVKVYKAGRSAKVEADWGNLSDVVVDDTISSSGQDWNFEDHQIFDPVPTFDDFQQTVGDYLAWEVDRLIEGGEAESPTIGPVTTSPDLPTVGSHNLLNTDPAEDAALAAVISQPSAVLAPFDLVGENGLFRYSRGVRHTIIDRVAGDVPLITAGKENYGVAAHVKTAPSQLFPANTITIDMFSNVFYRPYAYYADDNIISLSGDDFQPEHLLYIATAMQRSRKHGYDKQFRVGSLEDLQVFLPVLDDGAINWDLMLSAVRASMKKLANEALAAYRARAQVTREVILSHYDTSNQP